MSVRQQQIEAALGQAISIAHLIIEDESGGHNVPAGSESHFKVTVVSDDFMQQSLVARHRRIYDALRHQLQNGLHALAIHAYTLAEWEQRHGAIPVSPPCLGGGQK